MSKVDKTVNAVMRGTADANIRFDDLRSLLGHLGFVERIRGGHHVFARADVREIVNLQPKGNKAKPYQVKQVRQIILAYALADEPVTQGFPRIADIEGDLIAGGDPSRDSKENDDAG